MDFQTIALILYSVIPAEAGIRAFLKNIKRLEARTPAFAGMTKVGNY
jgi:hypothetical protein